MISSEKLLDWYKRSGKTIWQITNRDAATTYIAEVSDDCAGDAAKSAADLESYLEYLSPGTYWIIAKSNPKDSKGMLKEQFKIAGEMQGNTGIGRMGGMGGLGILDQVGGISGLVKMQVDTTLTAKENERLQKELEEAKKKSTESRWMDLAEKYHPYIGSVLPQFMQGLMQMFGVRLPAAVGVSGWNGEPVQQPAEMGTQAAEVLDETIPQKINESLTEWSTYEKDPLVMLTMIQMLCAGAKANDMNYAMFRTAALQQIEKAKTHPPQ